jgi:hypothetical protein
VPWVDTTQLAITLLDTELSKRYFYTQSSLAYKSLDFVLLGSVGFLVQAKSDVLSSLQVIPLISAPFYSTGGPSARSQVLLIIFQSFVYRILATCT